MATILVVDDHVLNREFLTATLADAGLYRLLEAADGQQALRLVRTERPDLIITDILMPQMDGYEFVSHLRADPQLRDIPVIFYTATYRESEANVMALACGVKWILPKAASGDVLLETARRALANESPSLPIPERYAPSPADTRHAMLEGPLATLGENLRRWHNRLRDASPADLTLANEFEQQFLKTWGELHSTSLRMNALIDLGIELAGERDPAHLLMAATRNLQDLCVGRYAFGALLERSAEAVEHFATAGVDARTESQLSSANIQGTLWERLLTEPQAVRMKRIDGNAQALGLPPGHPPVHTLLAVPVASPERAYGWLYLVDKLGAPQFNEADERVARTIAAQLARCYEGLVLSNEAEQNQLELARELSNRIRADETARRFRKAIDETDEAILLIDRESLRFVDANATAMRLLGYEREVLLRVGPADIGGGSRVELAERYDRLIGVADPARRIDAEIKPTRMMQLRHSDGTQLEFEVSERPFMTSDGWQLSCVARLKQRIDPQLTHPIPPDASSPPASDA